VSFLAQRRSPSYDYGMYEYGRYQGSVVAALVLILVCVSACSDHSHGVDESKGKRDQSTVGDQSTVDKIQCQNVGTQIELDKAEGTGKKLDRYAREAQPAWARDHRGKEWPDTIDELNKYIGACDSLDSWGHPIKLLCGARVPGGGCTPVSAGADGQFDTGDDQAPF
jgi:hypothetical protein